MLMLVPTKTSLEEDGHDCDGGTDCDSAVTIILGLDMVKKYWR